MWQNIENEPIVFGSKQINPQKYKVLKLDVASIKSFLNKTPLEFTAEAKNVNTVLELPMPDGTFEEFVIIESPMMEAALAQKFPEIKTYSGYSLKNPATMARLDFTQRGFHGMILSPEGTFFIDPYSTATIDYYISYDKKDFASKKSFTCAVDQIKQPNIDTPNTTTLNKEVNFPTGINASIGDGVLRNYRLALAATGEYTAYHGGTVALALAAQVTTMNRVNGIFLRDFAVKMNIIANNNLVIYTDATTDPYTNNNGSAMLTENINNLNNNLVIGSTNYDIGHVFSTGGGGVAYLRGPCGSLKGGGVTGSGSPVGDPFDIDYVAHEIGHQFGGNHTQNNSCQRNANTAFEPGSGYSIMGYAGICAPNVQNNSDAHFHGGNFSEMHTFITGNGNTCASKPTYTNPKPSITSNTVSQTIPKGTPFMLTGVATDADGNATLTYCWDQMDTQAATQPPIGTSTGGPSFRGFSPTSSGTRYFPRLSDLVANVSPMWEVLPTVARTLNFRLVVRDNATGGGANDRVDITLTIAGSAGPFIVNSPNNSGISYEAFSTQTVTWAVASTDIAPVSCANVDILLSTDGGLTYPTTLASNVPNSGSANVTIPNVSSTTARIMVKGTDRAFFDISNNNFTITSCTAPSAPTAVSVNNTSICSGSSVLLNATCASGTITWYNAISGGTSLGTGTGFSQTPASTITYYASCENISCKSVRVATNQVTVTAQPTNPTSVSVNNTIICPGNSVSLNATCASGTITWYNASTGGTSLGTGTGLSQTPASTITYYASCENVSCKSSRVATSQVTVTSQPTNPTAVSVNNTNICAGNSVSLAATCAIGTITWYNAISGGTALGTGTGFSQSPTSTITYYASCENASCKSARVATSQVTVAAKTTNPTSVAVNSINICEGNTVSLAATCATGTVTWYNVATGGASLGTGTGFSQSPASTITYYASCENARCKSARVTTNQVTVTAQPINPTSVSVNNTNICAGSSVSLAATCATGTITWYNSSTSGTAIGTGTGFSQSPTSTITYYASCENAICKSARVATNQVTVTAQPINPTSVAVNSINICEGNTVSLAATCATGTITWYNAATGGESLGTGTGFSQTPASSITYYASCENAICKSARVTTNQVTVTAQPINPTAVSVNNTNICDGSSVSLAATCATGTITWYNSSTSGTAIGTGTGLSQIPASTITYYASCENAICKSARVATSQVTVAAKTTNPTSVAVNSINICEGNTVSLAATCATGTITWYNSSTNGTAIGTGTGLSQTPASTITYFASCENANCKSAIVATNQVTVTAQPINPTAVSVNNTNICAGNSVSLAATCATGTITWYNSSTSGTAIGTGTGLSQTPASTITYFASCENAICKSARVATNQVTVLPQTNSITSNISTGTSILQASQTINASNKIISPAKVTYKAGNSISLNTGFEAQTGSVFLAQIQGCN